MHIMHVAVHSQQRSILGQHSSSPSEPPLDPPARTAIGTPAPVPGSLLPVYMARVDPTVDAGDGGIDTGQDTGHVDLATLHPHLR